MRARAVRHALGLLAAFLATGACSAPRVGLAVSALPNVGLEGSYDARVGSRGDWDLALDAHVAQQFLDDEAFSDDGNPSAGDWTQAGVALRASSAPVDRRSWTLRAGPEWFRARGLPNLIDEPGDYYGLRLGVGFETEVRPGVFVGPELDVMLVTGPESFRLVPQLTWGVRVVW